MNQVFQELLHKDNTVAMKEFLQWYNDKYPNTISLFQNLPFTMQLGVYLEYFESIYNLIVLVSTKGYRIQFTDTRITPIYGINNMQYNHYKFDYEDSKNIMIGYESAIKWLFENYNLPF
jgi:hypothetical protein